MRTLTALFILVSTACVAAQRPLPQVVVGCSQISLAQSGFGASYRGLFRNDDYKLSATIPHGLTGWGADSAAPFHGFTIFLTSEKDQSSCLILEIHLRVSPGEKVSGRSGARIAIGNITGWKTEAHGLIDGTEFSEVSIRFSVAHGGEVDDGSVWLVTPTRDLKKNRSILEDFLSRISFDTR